MSIQELCQALAAYHPDRVQPCIPSEVADLAEELGVTPRDVVRAIGVLLSEEYGVDQGECSQGD